MITSTHCSGHQNDLPGVRTMCPTTPTTCCQSISDTNIACSKLNYSVCITQTKCISKHRIKFHFSVDFGEVKTAPTECKEKCFQMMSSAYLHYVQFSTSKCVDVYDLSKKEVSYTAQKI